MSALSQAPDLPITLLEDDAPSSLQALRATAAGKALVIDFCACPRRDRLERGRPAADASAAAATSARSDFSSLS